MIDFSITLELHQGRTWPSYTFNHPFITENLIEVTPTTQEITLKFNSISDIKLTYKKAENETIIQDGKILQDQKLIIKHVYVDDILLDLDLVKENSHYWPNYHQKYLDYCHANNIAIEVGPAARLDFYHSGIWNFTLPENFWSWYANIKYNKNIRYMTADEIKLYIGSSLNDQIELLKTLKGLLDVY